MTVPIFQLEDIKPTFQDAIDSITIVLGKPCLVVCDGEKQPCPNCVFDAASGVGTGVYNGTGPRSFTNGKCPICKNTGFDPASVELRIEKNYLIQRNIKPYAVPGPQLTRPSTVARIKGFIDDVQPLMAMRYVVLDHKNQTAMQEKYEKLSEPEYSGNIVSGRYFRMFLKRIE